MMRAKKSLGQHFLRSEKALKSIVDAGELSLGDTVLEIGPGEGVLTERLLATSAKVTAVEKDDALYENLNKRFEREVTSGQLTLVHGDILDIDIESLEYNKLIANIPYNITGQIFRKFLSSEHQPEKMVLLVQKEVAERVVAKDGKESILSISVKVYGTPRYVETVKAGSFTPAPKVDSAIIAVEDVSKAAFENMSEETFFRALKAGFGQKRKKLSSNLSTVFPKERVLNAFQELGLDENTRAEDISIEVWHKIALYLST